MKETKKQDKEAELKENKETELINDIKRIQADFINYKNRIEKEKEAYVEYKLSKLILEMLDILDNFELSLKNKEDEGIKLIHKQFLNVLSKNGVKKIEKKEIFDANLHEAIEKREGEENKILEVIKDGYEFNNKIIRPAQVRVGGGK